MKAKSIKGILFKKFKSFCESIEDPKVRKLVEENTIITGGCIASMLLDEKVNDYDLYFRTRETTLEITKYLLSKFENPNKHNIVIDDSNTDRVKIVIQSSGVASESQEDNYKYFEFDENDVDGTEYIETSMATVDKDTAGKALGVLKSANKQKGEYRPVFLTTNAITLSDKIQVVTRFFGEPKKVHENFDFAHCTCYWKSWDRNLVLPKIALEKLLAKELYYSGSKYPLASIVRTRKFIKRGFQINAGQYLKMVMQLNELDLKDIAVLEEQLTGVDIAYFFDVITRLKEKGGKEVDTAYLLELVDKIF